MITCLLLDAFDTMGLRVKLGYFSKGPRVSNLDIFRNQIHCFALRWALPDSARRHEVVMLLKAQ